MKRNLKLDLFKLHRNEDNKDPRCWILANGSSLSNIIKPILAKLEGLYSKTEIANILASKIGAKIQFSKGSDSSDFIKEFMNKLANSNINRKKIAQLTGTSGEDWNKIEQLRHFPFCSKLQKVQGILGKFKSIHINCTGNDYCLKKLIIIQESLTKLDETPLIILEEILDLWRDSLNKSKNEFNITRMSLLGAIDSLRVNQHGSIQVEALKVLNEDLAKIIGAFCADGNLYPPDMIRWEEEHRSNLEALTRWLNSCFGVKVKIARPKRKQRRNSWKFKFRSKVIARYFAEFFNIYPGAKTYTTRMPERIRCAPKSIQKAFAIGAITFEGSANKDSTISFGVSSKSFRDDVASVVLEENPSIVQVATNANVEGCWQFYSNRRLNGFQKRLLLSYFEPNTLKYNKLRELIFGYEKVVSTLEEAKQCLDKRYSKFRSTSIGTILDCISQYERFSVYDIIAHINTRRKKVVDHLNILEKANIIQRAKRAAKGKTIYAYNPNITEWRLPNPKVV